MENQSVCHKYIINSEYVKYNCFLAVLIIIKKSMLLFFKKTRDNIERIVILKLTDHLKGLIASLLVCYK